MNYHTVAEKVLASVKEDYEDAFIAGGFVADVLLGLQPKDLDIFTFQTLDAPDENGSTLDYEEHRAGRIYGVQKLKGYPLEVELIQLHSPRSTSQYFAEFDSVKAFAFGIQQAWLSDGAPRMTAEWWRDFNDKTITVCRCRDAVEAMRLHRKHKRLLEKYGSEWKLVMPDYLPDAYKATIITGIPPQPSF